MQNSTLSQFPYNEDREIETAIIEKFKENTGNTEECTPFVKAFASTEIDRSILFLELDCRSWECSKCGPKLRLQWFEKQFEQTIDTKYLEYKIIHKSEWDTVRKQLSRKQAQYMKYERDNDRLLIVTDTRLDGIAIMPTQEARKRFLVETIANTPLTRQPISQSRKWNTAVKTPASTSQETKWQALDKCAVKSLSEVQVVLAEFGYTANKQEVNEKQFGVSEGIQVVLSPEDYFRVLWKLGAFKSKKMNPQIRK